MAQGLQVFEKSEARKFVYEEDLKHMRNHICGILNNWTLNYKFRYNMYSYSSKAYMVCRWRQSRGLPQVTKWGKAICKEELVIRRSES